MDAQEDDYGNPKDIDEEYSDDKRWPERSYHNERFFGYAFDADGAALCEFVTFFLPLPQKSTF